MKVPRLRDNIAALSALQATNLITTIIILPFTSRAFGIDAFGKVAFVQLVTGYLLLVTEYGFPWSASRKISVNRHDLEIRSTIFLSSWVAQWFILISCGILLVILVSSIPLLQENSTLYAAGFLIVIGKVIFPLWLMQGLERIKEASILQIISRIVSTILIISTITSPEDSTTYLIILGISEIASGILCITWLNNKKIILWKKPTLHEVKLSLRDGLAVFQSRISISLYTILIPLILGIVGGNVALGSFTLADRIRVAAQTITSTISQALFPRLSHLFAHDHDAAKKLVSTSLMSIIFTTGPMALILGFFAQYLVYSLAGNEYNNAAIILQILALVPLLVGLSNLYGVQVLLANGLTKVINLTAFITGITASIAAYIFIFYLQAEGAALTILIAEGAVAASYIIAVKYSKILEN